MTRLAPSLSGVCLLLLLVVSQAGPVSGQSGPEPGPARQAVEDAAAPGHGAGESVAEKRGGNAPLPVAADAAQPGRDWVVEKTGAFIPADLVFRDEEGRGVRLGELIDKPTLLLPVYYYCAGSCSRNLANLGVALSRMKSVAGKEFRAVAFSFNEEEKTEDARRARNNYLKLAGEKFPAQEWRFLTGDRDAIAVLTGALGYRFQKDDDGLFIHPSALVAVSREGKIIRYVYGDFIPGDLDMAVADAARNTPSLSVKRLLDICFNGDPDAGKGLFQVVKLVVLAVFACVVAAVLLRSRKRGPAAAGGDGATK